MDNAVGQHTQSAETTRKQKPEEMLMRVIRVAEILATSQVELASLSKRQTISSSQFVNTQSISEPKAQS